MRKLESVSHFSIALMNRDLGCGFLKNGFTLAQTSIDELDATASYQSYVLNLGALANIKTIQCVCLYMSRHWLWTVAGTMWNCWIAVCEPCATHAPLHRFLAHARFDAGSTRFGRCRCRCVTSGGSGHSEWHACDGYSAWHFLHSTHGFLWQ